ncbi:MAG: hypothetical protein ACJ8F3_07945 [Xanthobacteraceae bacterium]
MLLNSVGVMAAVGLGVTLTGAIIWIALNQVLTMGVIVGQEREYELLQQTEDRRL